MTLTIDTDQAREGATAPLSPPSTPTPSARVTLGWVAVLVVLAAAIALAVAVLQSPGSSTRSDGAPASSRQLPQGVPYSADAAERWLTGRAPGTAPGAEVSQAWQDLPRSADAAERWLDDGR